MLIKVKVFAGAKKEGISRKSENHFEICVKAKAERGEANRAVIRALAEHLKIPASRVRMIKGARRPSKIFEILQ
ncbi:MAG: DUF167 domain-containing protein [Candidatus Niyogibacteria bacterium]|nr:MAG: DUF167 domain-containing protein [Candidatus Niyogibacteria bacterium]